MSTKRILSGLLAVVLMLILFVPNVRAEDSATTGQTEVILNPGNFNIVGIIDGSGSLTRAGGWQSDVHGYRYDAFSMFLDLMPETGNEVGAIVFNCNPTNDTSEAAMLSGLTVMDIRSIESQEDKDELKNAVEAVPVTDGKTDIGTALLQAARMLEGMSAKNGKQSIILLFTDGFTEADYPAVKDQSIANKNTAIELIRKEEITLCGVFLNNNNVIKKGTEASVEVLNIVRDANGFSPEADPVTQMGGLYIEITSAKDLLTAYQNFYALLAQSKAVEFVKETSFIIPGIGVSDVNISILANQQSGATGEELLKQNRETIDNTSVTIIGPNGEFSEQEKAQFLSRGESYLCYKIQDPDPGPWKVIVNTPDDGMDVQCKLIVNVNTAAQLQTDPTVGEMALLQPIVFSANLYDNGTKITDPELYQGYSCYLVLSKHNEDGSIDEIESVMELDESGSFTTEVTLNEEASYTGSVSFRCGSAVSISSPVLSWNLINRKPAAPERHEVSIPKGLFSKGLCELDLSELVTDDNPLSYITYDLDRGSYPADACDDSDLPKLKIDGAAGGDGVMTVTFTDAFGDHASTELVITVKNRLILDIVLILVVLLLAAAGFGVYLWRRKGQQSLDGKLRIRFCVIAKDQIDTNVDVEFYGNECINKSLGRIFDANKNKIIDEAYYNYHINDDAADIMGRYLKKYADVFAKIKVQAGPKVDNKKNPEEAYYSCRISAPQNCLPNSEKYRDLRNGSSVILNLDKDNTLEIEYSISDMDDDDFDPDDYGSDTDFDTDFDD